MDSIHFSLLGLAFCGHHRVTSPILVTVTGRVEVARLFFAYPLIRLERTFVYVYRDSKARVGSVGRHADECRVVKDKKKGYNEARREDFTKLRSVLLYRGANLRGLGKVFGFLDYCGRLHPCFFRLRGLDAQSHGIIWVRVYPMQPYQEEKYDGILTSPTKRVILNLLHGSTCTGKYQAVI